jgi:DNA-binding MarR family transcriptional regulator
MRNFRVSVQQRFYLLRASAQVDSYGDRHMNNASDNVCDRDVLKALLQAIALYQEHSPRYSLVHFAAFLKIASEGQPIQFKDVARAIGTPAPVVSVAVGHLGPYGRGPARNPSMPPNLIDSFVHPVDSRSKLLGLTSKGAELAAKMRAILGGKCADEEP